MGELTTTKHSILLNIVQQALNGVCCCCSTQYPEGAQHSAPFECPGEAHLLINSASADAVRKAQPGA